MEETFQMFLSRKQGMLQEDLDIARKCFEIMTNDFSYGTFLIEKSHSKEFNEYHNAILCFKTWMYNFWKNSLNFNQKKQVIESLFQLLNCNTSLSLCILDIFTIIVQNDKEMLNYFPEYIPIIIQSVDLNERAILENLLFFLSKLFSLSDDNEFYYLLYKQYFYPIFTNSSFLENNENFPFTIYNYLIKCFSFLFFGNYADINDIIIPIEFSKYIISNFNDTRLVSRCSRFFRKCFFHEKTRDILNSFINDILLLHINNIGRFIQNGDDYVVYNFLRTIHLFDVYPECFEVFKSAACLTQDNINDFYSNPFVFYSIIYSSSSIKFGPRGFAICAIDTLFLKYPDMIQNLDHLGINELSMRIFGYLSQTSIKKNQLFLAIREKFINLVLKYEFNDPILISSKIYLVSKTTDLFDNSYLINLFLTYFETSNDVIRLLLCKIACKMKFFTQKIPNLILAFLPFCQNHSAFKALNRIALKQPEILFNDAKSIIFLNILSIEEEFGHLNEDCEYEIDLGKISCNLTLLTLFVQPFLLMVQPDAIVNLINLIICYKIYDEDTVYKLISDFLIQIFHECSNNESYFELSVKIMTCIITNLFNRENKDTFIEYFGQVFLFAISNNRDMFLNLNISSSLICVCLEILYYDSPPVLITCDIISFIIQIDPSLDCHPFIILTEDFLNRGKKNPSFILGYSNILSSIIVTGHDILTQINPSIFFYAMENNYYVRMYDKHLTAAALICFPDENFKLVAKTLHQQEIDQKNMTESDYARYLDNLDLPISIKSYNDYPFLAPFQKNE